MHLLKWTEKYRPAMLDGVVGNAKAVEQLRSWANEWEKGSPQVRAVILYGPAGVGKTSAAHALAAEMRWDLIEMNASDDRTAGSIEGTAGPASRIRTFSGRPRLIVLDEADNLHGNADRGGASAMLRLVRGTSQPIILIANEYYDIDRALRDACLGIAFRAIRTPTIASALREICRSERIACDPDALTRIAESSGGDLRSAINDLQAAAQGSNELKIEDIATGERDIKSSIFKVLEVVFKRGSAVEALKASYSLDESPEDLIHWIDENLPAAYKKDDLYRGFESLSRADVFLGRVKVRQSYGLWRYASFFMTAGIAAARGSRLGGYTPFRPPGLWRRLGQTKKARMVRDSAAAKIAHYCHVGTPYAKSELMSFVGLLLSRRQTAANVAAGLDLTAEEIALLTGSSASTKNVMTIYSQAQEIREAKRVEEIEFVWGKRTQEQLARPEVVVGSGSADIAENAGREDSTIEQPKRRRGRPKKENAPRENKDEPAGDEGSRTGRMQRSLLEF